MRLKYHTYIPVCITIIILYFADLYDFNKLIKALALTRCRIALLVVDVEADLYRNILLQLRITGSVLPG